MVTAETAVTIPVILLVLVLMVSALSVVLTQGTACHAARIVAREVSLGKNNAEAMATAAPILPQNSAVSVLHNGDWATISVTFSSTGPFRFQSKCDAVTRLESVIR